MASHIQKLHDHSWREVKTDYSFYRPEQRFGILKDIIISQAPGTILDVGCGSGYLAHLIKKEKPYFLVHGFDVSTEALKQAKALDKKYALNINHDSIPEKDTTYDLVVCSEVLEHLVNVQHCLKEIGRVLKNNGKLLVTVPNFAFWKFRIDSLMGRVPYVVSDEMHLQTFNKTLISSALFETGFEVMDITGIRSRLKILLKISASWFSETLIVTAGKKVNKG
jgi:methionine biosynthesis protein MetW